MTPREIVLAQIRHQETAQVPYTLAFEEDVGTRLDRHFGGPDWRKRLMSYVAWCGGPTRPPREQLDPAHYRDAFGTVWRTDMAEPVVVEPGLKAPTFNGYSFPSPDAFLDPAAKAEAQKRATESPDVLTIVSPGICLWDSWYLRGFQTTMMDCIAEEGFYAELLDRLTELCLALVDACREVPADAIMMGDDWGNQRGVMIGPERWRGFYKPRYARIFRAVHSGGRSACTKEKIRQLCEADARGGPLACAGRGPSSRTR